VETPSTRHFPLKEQDVRYLFFYHIERLIFNGSPWCPGVTSLLKILAATEVVFMEDGVPTSSTAEGTGLLHPDLISAASLTPPTVTAAGKAIGSAAGGRIHASIVSLNCMVSLSVWVSVQEFLASWSTAWLASLCVSECARIVSLNCLLNNILKPIKGLQFPGS